MRAPQPVAERIPPTAVPLSRANCSAARRASWVASAIIAGLMLFSRVKLYWMPDPSWMATPPRISSNCRA